MRMTFVKTPLVWLLALVASSAAQDLAGCEEALVRADENKDGRISRAEYIDLLADLSPYEGCPDLGMASDFFGNGVFNVAFEAISCLCKTYDSNPFCCTAEQVLAVPGVYPDLYTNRLCDRLYSLLDKQCTSATVSPTSSPVAAIVPTPDGNTDRDINPLEEEEPDDDDHKSLRIALPIALIALAAAFVAFFVHQRRKHDSKSAWRSMQKDGIDPTEASEDGGTTRMSDLLTSVEIDTSEAKVAPALLPVYQRSFDESSDSSMGVIVVGVSSEKDATDMLEEYRVDDVDLSLDDVSPVAKKEESIMTGGWKQITSLFVGTAPDNKDAALDTHSDAETPDGTQVSVATEESATDRAKESPNSATSAGQADLIKQLGFVM